MRFKTEYLMNLCLMAITAGVVVSALDWPLKASLFPLVVAIPVFFMALGDLVLNLAGKRKKEKKSVVDFTFSKDTEKGLALRRTLITCAWIGAFFLGVILLGFPAAIPFFVFSYLKFQAGEKWGISLLTTAIIWGAFWGLFIVLLHTRFPRGLLPQWFSWMTM